MIFIAHRGNNNNKVENKVEGILETVKLPYIDGVEIDIHMTKDGKFVLSHNLLLKESLLEYHAITKYKLKELKRQNFFLQNKPFPIHTLSELLKQYPQDKILLIECKTDNTSKPKFIKNLYKCLKKHIHKNIKICSFDYTFLKTFKNKYPKINCGLIVGYTLNQNKPYKLFDFISLQYRDIKISAKCKYIWTVNDLKTFNKVSKQKVQGIISDKIGNLLEK